jgi:hypothetical protein
MEVQLLGNITLKIISKAEYDAFRSIHEPKIFPNKLDINVIGAYSPAEKTAIDVLSANLGTPYELRYGFFHDQILIGWSYGLQIAVDTFRMVTTGIIKEFQCRGIYSAFLDFLIIHLKQKGFQVIFSRTYATNNQVIVPKLKNGFLISGLELTDEFGILVRLSYFFNETRRKAMQFRAGELQPDESIKNIIRKY